MIAFEGVLDRALGGNYDFSKPQLRCVPMYVLLCTYQGERLKLGREEVNTYTATPPREQPAAIVIRGIWNLFGQ